MSDYVDNILIFSRYCAGLDQKCKIESDKCRVENPKCVLKYVTFRIAFLPGYSTIILGRIMGCLQSAYNN